MKLLLQNLKDGVAFKGLVIGIKNKGFWIWLRNEIVPSWHIQYTGWWSQEAYQEILAGWFGLHLCVAVGLAAILGINWWQMAIIAFGIEVFQFLRDKAAFILPINSALDIGSYTLWVWLYTRYIGWSLLNLGG